MLAARLGLHERRDTRPWYNRAALLIPWQRDEVWHRLETARRTPGLLVPADADATIPHHGSSTPSHHKDGPVVLAFRPSNNQPGSGLQFTDTVADWAKAPASASQCELRRGESLDPQPGVSHFICP